MSTLTTDRMVPFIPENAPFTEEQRQWLNGFLAGLFSEAPAPGAVTPVLDAAPTKPVLVLFGSQTGNAEGLAKKSPPRRAGGASRRRLPTWPNMIPAT